MARLDLLFVASECVPLVKTGGLGDVVGSLPAALHARGHDVRVVLPRYRMTRRYPAERLPEPIGVVLGDRELRGAVYRATLPSGVPAYLIEHDALFDRDGVYGDELGDFTDNLLRYAFLSRAALELCRTIGFAPDVVHAHDWQAALVPVYARMLGIDVPTVLSIHNLGYQGRFAGAAASSVGLAGYVGLGLEYFGDLALLKGGIVQATLVSTVSPRYALEIQTPEGGAGLDGVLRARGDDLVGILNGIDDEVWSPALDEHLPAPYDVDDLAGKAVCKKRLQEELGLAPRPEVPLLGVVSRLVEQKGIDVLVEALEDILALDVQLAVLGAGDGWAEQLFRRLSESGRPLRARIGFDEPLAHRIEAGADLFLMPSRYEPCGLNQLYSQRYGTPPIVRAVGGLDDTVEHGVTGFKFERLSGDALSAVVREAVTLWRRAPERYAAMQRACMTKPLGWDHAATQYDALYRLAIRRHDTTPSPGSPGSGSSPGSGR